MTQVPNYIVEDGDGLSVLASITELFAAVRDDNAGPAAPPNPVAGMRWRDTSVNPSVLRVRNAANSAWVEFRVDMGILGVGSAALTDVTNLDTLTRGDLYHGTPTAVGNPLPGSWVSLLHLPTNHPDWGRQHLWVDGSPRQFSRFKDNGVWGSWTEAPGALGFTPVQQGGVPGHGTNKIYFGWATDGSGLRVRVDNVDIGHVLFRHEVPIAPYKPFSPGGSFVMPMAQAAAGHSSGSSYWGDISASAHPVFLASSGVIRIIGSVSKWGSHPPSGHTLSIAKNGNLVANVNASTFSVDLAVSVQDKIDMSISAGVSWGSSGGSANIAFEASISLAERTIWRF